MTKKQATAAAVAAREKLQDVIDRIASDPDAKDKIRASAAEAETQCTALRTSKYEW